MKAVDNMQLFDYNKEDAFYHIFEYLLFCAKNGISIKNKFQFYQDLGQFGDLQITFSGVIPSENFLNTITNFLVPKNISDILVWISRPIALAYSLSLIMSPLWDLIKQNSHFVWDQDLKNEFC